MSDAAKALVLSLDVTDAAASKSGFTTNGADDNKVRCLENKRQSPTRSQSPSPTSGLSDVKAQEVAEVRAAGKYHRIGRPISGPPSQITTKKSMVQFGSVPFDCNDHVPPNYLRCPAEPEGRVRQTRPSWTSPAMRRWARASRPRTDRPVARDRRSARRYVVQ